MARPASGCFLALAAACFGSGCSDDAGFADPPPRATLGEAVYQIAHDNLARSTECSDARLVVLEARREAFIEAFDTTLTEALVEGLPESMAVALLPRVDDGALLDLADLLARRLALLRDDGHGSEPLAALLSLLRLPTVASRAQLLDLMVRSPHLGDLRPHPPADRLTQLEVARAAGLAVPATAVEMEPAAVTAFLAEHPNGVVTKAGARGVGGRTRRVLSATDLAPGRPHLLQAFVPKMADLRVFFLEGRCWTIALFPQSAEASVDHRVEGLAGSRAAPYRLPAGPAAAIADFMSAVGLNTGSLDLVLRPDGGHVFLEVNPSGQFSAVGRICGVDLEGEVARTLRRLAGRPEVEPGPLRLARPLERPLW